MKNGLIAMFVVLVSNFAFADGQNNFSGPAYQLQPGEGISIMCSRFPRPLPTDKTCDIGFVDATTYSIKINGESVEYASSFVAAVDKARQNFVNKGLCNPSPKVAGYGRCTIEIVNGPLYPIKLDGTSIEYPANYEAAAARVRELRRQGYCMSDI